MPYSYDDDKQTAKQWIEAIAPKTVVDVGPGAGTYSDLARANGQHWTAIEAWAVYIEQFKLRDKYDHIIVADANYVDPKYFKADLVIIGDCIEHMLADEAIELIAKIKKHAKNLIISIPLGHFHQDAYQGNYFEEHKATWEHEQMMECLGDVKASVKGERLGYYWWSK